MTAGLPRRAVLGLTALGLAASVAVAQAAPMSMSVPLTGSAQVPPVATKGSGTALLTYDPSSRLLTWSVSYSGLTGPVTMAHVHGPAPAGKNAGVEIWITKMGQPAPSPITGQATLTPAEATQLMQGLMYVNVHTRAHPGGEIRGQVIPPKG